MLFESWQTIKRKPIPPTTLQRQMPEPQPPTPKTPKVTKQKQRMATQTNSTKYATTENTETFSATYIRQWWSNHGCQQLNIISWATPDIHIMLKKHYRFQDLTRKDICSRYYKQKSISIAYWAICCSTTASHGKYSCPNINAYMRCCFTFKSYAC